MKATRKHLNELDNALDLLVRANEYIGRSEGLCFETDSPNGGDYTIRNVALSVDNEHTTTSPRHLVTHSKNGSPLVFIDKAIRQLSRTIESVS